MTPTRALIEAAEEILESYDLLIDAAENHFKNPTLAGVIRGGFFKIESFRAAISSAKAAEGVETKVEIRYRVDTVLFGKATPCSAAVKTREEAESYRLPIDRMTRIETREFIEVREKEGL